LNTSKKTPLRKNVKKSKNLLKVLKNTSTSITVIRIVTDIIRIISNLS